MATHFTPKGNKVNGTNKKDTISWQSSSDWQQPLIVHGKKGNDKIVFLKSYFNKNKLYGDAGKDTIIASMKNDFIWGGTGNDIITGNSGDDQIHCGAGLDLADGGSGKDKIWCDSGANAVSGGSKNDTIYGGTGYDAISGGSGNDIIKLKAFSSAAKTITFKLNSTLSKIFGEKSITFDASKRAFVFAGTGHDKIYDIQGGSYVDGGSGNDTITAISGNNTIIGGKGEDSITGGTGNDYIDAGDSADIIKVKGGNNTIKGGRNNDKITGGSGNDTIYGGTNEDTINAGGGINEIRYKQGDGHDIIISGGGDDTLVFEDNMYIKNSDWSDNGSGNDLIIKYTSDGTKCGSVTLKDFRNGGHSVHSVYMQDDYYVVNSDGTITKPYYLFKTPKGFSNNIDVDYLKQTIAGLKTNDIEGTDIPDAITGAKEENIIAVAANNYTKQTY